jgi:5-methylthioadenosine/S-adenosylhomocysteine deaminase
MIRSGTTTFVDMYYFEDQVAEAAKEAGMRTVAGETLIEFPAPDNKTVADALAYTERFLKRWAGDPSWWPRSRRTPPTWPTPTP